MLESLKVSTTLPVSPEKVYKAWLSSKEHSAFTGGEAKIANKVGGKFTAWDGYITGKTLELKPYKKIVQSWRTSEFAKSDADSKLEVVLEKIKAGTKITLIHTQIPKGGKAEYKEGWQDYYFKPMKEYFTS